MITGKDVSMSDDERFARARCSFEGLSVGDALGRAYDGVLAQGRISSQAGTTSISLVFHRRYTPWRFPSFHCCAKTERSIRIVWLLISRCVINMMPIVAMVLGCMSYFSRINGGQPWREASQSQFAGQGSFGNGAAMRMAPLGAYFADSIETVIEQAQASAE